MSSSNSFGWDLLFKTIESQVHKNTDVLIALVHLVLINTKFRCIGVGEDKTFSDDEEGTELLPDGWNDTAGKYALRYTFDNKLYVLLATVSEHVLIVNLLDVETKKVSNVGLDPEDLVASLRGPLKAIMPTSPAIMDRIRTELIEPVFAGSTKTVTTQTPPDAIRRSDVDFDPLRLTAPHRAPGFRGPIGNDPFGFPPGGIGTGDLDPLGRGAGNMGVLPRLAPTRGGARFDPFGPGPGVRRNPNNDEFQPPGFGDYYM